MLRSSTLVVSLVLLSVACQPAAEIEEVAAAPTRPTFDVATTEAYDFTTIGGYAGDHSAVHQYVDENLDRHFAALQRWLRQPSISAQNVGAWLGRTDIHVPIHHRGIDADNIDRLGIGQPDRTIRFSGRSRADQTEDNRFIAG